ncbi:hypothetical protein HY484_00355 [Candidatus Woesearchaeota archaeon]|nr:hypothetical protein [Candidatus Woesearchaeota archaeon]
MRKLFLLLFTVLLASFVFAGKCTDSDKGPVDLKDVAQFLAVGGLTTDDFKSHEDRCVRSEFSDRAVDKDKWVREYYCSGGLALSKSFKCSDYGFDVCVKDEDGRGYCYGGKAKEVPKDNKTKVVEKPKVDFYCGDVPMKRSDAECYPPGKLCVKNRLPGACSKSCKCVVVDAGDEEEETEEQSEEKNGEKPEAGLEIKVPLQEKVSTTPPKQAEKKEVPVKQGFTLKIIAGVSNTVKKAWSGLWGLFS